jgi:serine protease SohB
MKSNIEIQSQDKIFKKIAKSFKKLTVSKKRLFVIDFNGDASASQVDELKKIITSIIVNKQQDDAVLLRLESPGGMAHRYGLAAYELIRLKKAGIELIAAIDSVAASGGYMMACVADKIIAAPFSYVGSIGVMGGVFNFHDFLKELGIKYLEFTAGEYKNPLSQFGPITEKGEKYTQEFINRSYKEFKKFVKLNRPTLDIDKVATGEAWTAQEAIKFKLVDRLATSEEMILELSKNYNIFEIKYNLPVPKEPFWKKILKKILPF